MLGKNREAAYLTQGSKVEVLCDDDEEFQDTFFPAIVLQPPDSSSTQKKKNNKSSNSKVLIQYQTMLCDNGSEPLLEYKDISNIRPLPPSDTVHKKLKTYDFVDAFHNDVWWTGVLTKVEGDKYSVAFKKPPDYLQFTRSELRSHWDWDNGIWVKRKIQKMEGLVFIPETAVEVKLGDEHRGTMWLPATFLGEVGVNSFLVEYSTIHSKQDRLCRKVVSFHRLRPPPPNLEGKNFNLFEKVDACYHRCWCAGEITKVHEETKRRYTVMFTHAKIKKTKQFNQSELRPQWEWSNEQWFTNSKVTEHQEAGEPKCQETVSVKKRGRPKSSFVIPEPKVFKATHRCGNLLSSATVKESNELKVANVKIVEEECEREEIGFSGILALESKERLDSHAENSSEFPIQEVIQQNDVGMSIGIKEKGVQAESVVANLEVYVTGEEHDGARSVVADCLADECEMLGATIMKLTGCEGEKALTKITDYSTEKTEKAAAVVFADVSTTILSSSMDMEEIKKAVDAVSGNAHADDQPLARTGMEEIHSEAEVGNPGCEVAMRDKTTVLCGTDSLTKKTENALDRVSGNVTVNNHTLLEVGDPGHCEQGNSSNLPFRKSTTLIWKHIESMEAFKKFPQKPHFCPLEKYGELFREGEAIKNMIIFASMFEEFASLQVEERKETIQSCLDALVELEEFGFEVKALQDRLNELLSIKVKSEQLQVVSKETEFRIMERTDEMSKLDEEIEDIDQEILRLKERRACLISKCLEINKLKGEAAVIDENIQSMEESFRSLVSTSW